MELLQIICIALVLLVLIINIILFTKLKGMKNTTDIEIIKEYIAQQNRENRIEITNTMANSVKNISDILSEQQMSTAKLQHQRLENMEQKLNSFALTNENKLEAIRATVNNRLDSIHTNNDSKLESIRTTVEQQLNNIQKNNQSKLTDIELKLEKFTTTNENKLKDIERTVHNQLETLRADNNKKLDEMRGIVDEKLQKTLDQKLTDSFAQVSNRLQEVYKGLGEMQALATGVGDLKKVLSNVKTRGILGEIQLGAILKEILSTEQYDENVVTKKGTRNPVEFAVKLPNDNNSYVYLPIDSKFPADTYQALLTAQESGDKNAIALAVKQLISTIKKEAKDISDKYIDPPNTTEFAIMFLPFEGLYSEVVNRGMVEELQRLYKINIAGPSTMAALLNSLQMGFKTLAVQKRSAEVWNVLSEVKREFDTFGGVLEDTKKHINKVNEDLDKLVGVRTRQIRRKLSQVSENNYLDSTTHTLNED
ncbi:MAG: DNA recombination protein RmuC [Acutalibacteraceae bacterium]|nr:DNA recombination protein RmuC [Acutalibacteraceae bacterium]